MRSARSTGRSATRFASAVRAFQERNGLAPDGYADLALLKRVGAARCSFSTDGLKPPLKETAGVAAPPASRLLRGPDGARIVGSRASRSAGFRRRTSRACLAIGAMLRDARRIDRPDGQGRSGSRRRSS